MLGFTEVAVGAGEPSGCVLCAAPAAPAYLPSATIAARIRDAAAAWTTGPGPNIVLGGPEPFEHPELPLLVAECVQAGVERIALETDGAALSVPANAVGVLRSGVRHLRVRVLDVDPDRGDEMSGRPGRARDTLSGIRAYLAAAHDAGIPVVATAIVPVCRHNARSLSATIAQLASCGLHAVRLVPTADRVSPAVLSAACDTGMVNRLWVEADPALHLPVTHALHAVAEAVRRD